MKTIVVIGGTGHFGKRICRRLVCAANVRVIITSRRQDHAQQTADELAVPGAAAVIVAAALDQSSSDFEQRLTALAPDVVIHTAGPYQRQDYRVALGCIAAGSHYVDLADGRDFVQGFNALHKAAISRNVLLVSGASTLPGISSVVVDAMRPEFEAIDEIAISIAPAHQTPRGRGTIAAVLSYCGTPFNVLQDGEWTTQYGWQNLRSIQYPALGRRRGAACDVPDLGLLPEYVPGVRTVTFHAALEAQREQLVLWTMAWLTRSGAVKKWDSLVPTFQKISDRMIRFGSDAGGMQITVTGTGTDAAPKKLTWNLMAYDNHGPEIPCSPALILARKLLAGTIDTRGAHACLGMFTLADLEQELDDFSVRWDTSSL